MSPSPSPSPGPHRRVASLVLLLVAGLALEAVCLWFDRISIHDTIVDPAAREAIVALWRPFEALAGPIATDSPWTAENVKIFQFFVGMVPAILIYLLAILLVRRRLAGDRRALILILGFSALFRLTLVPCPGILETDLHRYLLDGAVIAHGISPYKYSPEEIRTSWKRPREPDRPDEEVRELQVIRHVLETDPLLAKHFRRVNHPRIRTIYPPLTQLAYGVSYLLGPARQDVWKLLVALVDLALLGVLLVYLVRLGRDPDLIILYGWCPMILKEYANTGHHDPLATLLAVMALWYVHRGHSVVAGFVLGCAALAKLYPLVLIPVFGRRLGVRGVVTAGLTVVLGYLPFLTTTGLSRSTHGLGTFSMHWEFNSSLFTLIDRTLQRALGNRSLPAIREADQPESGPTGDDETGPGAPRPYALHRLLTRILVGLLLLVVIGSRAHRAHDTFEEVLLSAFWTIGAVFLLTPVADPWYIGWVMPYVTLFPMTSWVYLSASVCLYYIYFWIPPSGAWGYKPWVRLLEYGPFYALLMAEARRRPPWWTPGVWRSETPTGS